MMTQENKIPLHDIAAEEALLGAVLLSDTAMNEISLLPTDFYHEPHMVIFQAMLNLVKSYTHIDEITLGDELDRMGKLELSGGSAYIASLLTLCPSPMDAPSYAEIIKRLSTCRQLIKVGKEIQQVGFSNPADTAKALSECDEKLINIRKGGVASPILSPKDRVEMLFERYAELHSKEMVMALNTGIYDLDRHLGGGFYNGDVVIVGARTGVGKTTFLSYLANQIAIYHNVLFCSAEMNADSISDREVAQSVGIPTNRIRLGNYDSVLFSNILNALGEISERKVYLYDEIPMTTDKILQAALNMQLRHGLGAVVIDYLGMLGDDFGRSSYERASYISRKVKELARKLDVPVIIAHQLNRELEKRDDKRPHLYDLRDSGSIEQDADVVLFLYRDSYYDETKEMEGMTEIIIAKQRQGDANRIIKVRYDKKTQSYQNLATHKEENLL
jgi:replicative DNA helicase